MTPHLQSRPCRSPLFPSSSPSWPPAAWSSSSTRKTARTKATSCSPPTTSRPKPSTSWPSYGRGLICLTLTRERCERLHLPPMAARNGTSTAPRSRCRSRPPTASPPASRPPTARAPCRPRWPRDAKASDLVQPGHIFPLQAQDGGVLMRAGHTEAGCDLAAMAGLTPAAVICEIMKDDGTMARLPGPRGLRRGARPEDRHHRRPDRIPQPQRDR